MSERASEQVSEWMDRWVDGLINEWMPKGSGLMW